MDTHLDRAWGVAIGCGLLFTFSIGPFVLFSYGLFVGPIASDLGVSVGRASTALGPAAFAAALSSPVLGYLGDRFGQWRVLVCSVPTTALGLLCLGLAPRNFAAFTAIMTLAMTLGLGLGPVVVYPLVSGWFRARRGLALNIVAAIHGVALFLVPPIASLLIDKFGWRGTYIIFSALVLVVGLFAVSVLVRDPPKVKTSAGGSASAVEQLPGVTLRNAISGRRFWIFICITALMAVGLGAGTTHFVPILHQRGFSNRDAAYLMSVVGAAMVIGPVLSGWIFDRLRANFVTAAICCFEVAFFLILLFAQSEAGAFFAAISFGIARAMLLTGLTYMASLAFGLKEFGRIYGVICSVWGLLDISGGSVMGILVDEFGSYEVVLSDFAAVTAVGAILVLALRQKDLPYTTARSFLAHK